MFTIHVGSMARRSAAFLLLLGSLGCNKGGSPQTVAEEFCGSLGSYVQSCAGAATPCDQAMIDDCTGLTSLVSDGFLRSASDCILGGGQPLGCLVDAIGGLAPTAAHEAFAGAFCKECAFGVPGCEDILLGKSEGAPELAAAAAVILPLGDVLVDGLREKCTSGLTCAATFPSCAQAVLLEQSLPDQTVQCLLDSLTGKAPPVMQPEGGGGACGLGGDTDGAATGNPGDPGGPTPTTDGEAVTTGSSGDVVTGNDSGDKTTGGPGPGPTTTGGPDDSGPDDSGPDDSGPDDSGMNTTNPGPDLGGDTDGWEQLCAGPFSAHNECEAGAALPSECTWCTYLICEKVDDFCCKTEWDAQCTGEANMRCAMACGATTDLCAHTPCSPGIAMVASCSDCVMAVCDSRPSCCETEWDSACVELALSCGIC